jgi:DNA polymerase-3 subunit gamma/tau
LQELAATPQRAARAALPPVAQGVKAPVPVAPPPLSVTPEPAPTPAPLSPAPAPAFAPEPVPTTIAAAADGDVPDWSSLLGRLNVQAMAQQLAKHCVMESVAGQLVVLRLAQEHKHLQTKMATDNLQTALGDYFGHPVKLSIVLGKIDVATPAKIERDTQQARQQQASDSIAQDRFVIEAQQQLGAALLSESVKYVNQ